jgi:hypothetical protein
MLLLTQTSGWINCIQNDEDQNEWLSGYSTFFLEIMIWLTKIK